VIDGDRHDAELWVLGENAFDQLTPWCATPRTACCNGCSSPSAAASRNVDLLRVRPSKQPPPQLILEAQPFARYLKLDNLFLPAGTKLHPVLRRDAIRKLLADDPARIKLAAAGNRQPAHVHTGKPARGCLPPAVGLGRLRARP